MNPYNSMKPMFKRFRKVISLTLIAAFVGSSLYVPKAQAGEMVMPIMPKPGTMVNLSPVYTPAYLKGIVIHPDNALKFDFLVHKGDGNLDDAQKRQEYNKLIKYFLAALTVPDKDQWVNLSPYEKNRIVENDFGATEMGRDLLSQDYLLKQITSSLMYPESGLGKVFWDKVYERAYKEYGTTNIPVNTFNKVWIVPDEALIYESGNTAYVVKSHLKVMLEEDYLSLEKHNSVIARSPQGDEAISKRTTNDTHAVASKIIKEVILPEIEKEVNTAKNFAMLRQVFSGMVLATWYKKALKESLLGKVYADKAKIQGVNVIPAQAGIQKFDAESIYRKYLAAFKKGVYNFIKEDTDKYTNQVIPRKYFAGGFYLPSGYESPEKVSRAMLVGTVLEDPDLEDIAAEVNPAQVSVNLAMITSIESSDGRFSAQLIPDVNDSRFHQVKVYHEGKLIYNDRDSFIQGIRFSDDSTQLIIEVLTGDDERLDIVDEPINLAEAEAKFRMNGELPNAAMVINDLKPYEDVGSMYRDLPGVVKNLMDSILGSPSLEPLQLAAVTNLMEATRRLYEKMKLTIENYHNHMHHLAVTQGALILAANAGLIKERRDLIVTFLASLLHDFHLREVRPLGESKPASPAFVHETLGRPGTDEGGQLPDLLGVNNFNYTRSAINDARYDNKHITRGEKQNFQIAYKRLVGQDDPEQVYDELAAIIRRTDFASDVLPANETYQSLAFKIRNEMDSQAAEWTDQKTVMADELLDDLIKNLTAEYVKIFKQIKEDNQLIANAARQVQFDWITRQKDIELNFLEALRKIKADRRLKIYQIANLVELSDQSESAWIGSVNVAEDITRGLKQELPFVSLEANYPMFYVPHLLVQRVLPRLNYLPLSFKANLVNILEHFARLSTAYAKSKGNAANAGVPERIFLKMLQSWSEWVTKDRENVLMELGIFVDYDGVIKEQQKTYREIVRILRKSVLGRAFSLTDVYYMVRNQTVKRTIKDPHTTIIPQGQEVDLKGKEAGGVYFVLSGSVNVLRNGDVIATLNPGDNFGEMAFISRLPRNATIVTGDERAVLLSMQGQYLQGLRLTNPNFNSLLLDQIPARSRPDLQESLPQWARSEIIMKIPVVNEEVKILSPRLEPGVQQSSEILTPGEYQNLTVPILERLKVEYPDDMPNVKMVAIVKSQQNSMPPLPSVVVYEDPRDKGKIIVFSSELFKQEVTIEERIKAVDQAIDFAMKALVPDAAMQAEALVKAWKNVSIRDQREALRELQGIASFGGFMRVPILDPKLRSDFEEVLLESNKDLARLNGNIVIKRNFSKRPSPSANEIRTLDNVAHQIRTELIPEMEKRLGVKITTGRSAGKVDAAMAAPAAVKGKPDAALLTVSRSVTAGMTLAEFREKGEIGSTYGFNLKDGTHITGELQGLNRSDPWSTVTIRRRNNNQLLGIDPLHIKGRIMPETTMTINRPPASTSFDTGDVRKAIEYARTKIWESPLSNKEAVLSQLNEMIRGNPGLTEFEQFYNKYSDVIGPMNDVYYIYSSGHEDRRNFAPLAQTERRQGDLVMTKGGIDLNSANLAMVIKRDGKGVPLPVSQQDMAQLSRIQGFVPRILEIKPVSSLPFLSDAK